jgi:hypothetical protein
MPLFGKRDAAPKSPEEMAAARERRAKMLEIIGATMSDMGSNFGGEQGTRLQALTARDQKLAMQRQQQQAYADLMGSYRGPDMETAGVNELIGGANETGAGFGMAPMQRQDPRYQPGFDPAAIGKFFGQGGSAADAKAMQDLMNPPSNRRFVTGGAGRYGTMDTDTGEIDMGAPDPMQQQLLQAQIDALLAQAGQRTQQGNAAIIRATQQPPPRAGAAPVAGPSIDQPWTMFKQ